MDAKVDGRRVRGADNRKRIVDALLKLVEGGAVSPSAEQVAGEAGVGLRTVFRHFSDMDSLYREISERMTAEIKPIIEQPCVSVFELIERRHNLNAGVANQNVEPIECLDGFGHAGLDLVFLGDVHRNADRFSCAAEGCGRGVGARLIQIGDDHLRTLSHEEGRDFLADAARGACYDGDFVFETHEILLLLTQIVVNDAAETQRQIGDQVYG